MGNNSSFQVNIMAPLIVGVLGVAFIIVFVVLCVRACREKNSARNRVHIVIDDINRRNLDNKT
jgi:hypothetical protein